MKMTNLVNPFSVLRMVHCDMARAGSNDGYFGAKHRPANASSHGFDGNQKLNHSDQHTQNSLSSIKLLNEYVFTKNFDKKTFEGNPIITLLSLG